jgi:uncharacterized protein
VNPSKNPLEQLRNLRLPPRVRGLVRACHRDVGYVAVGLTVVYALSGLAVNHLADWDPNFTNTHEEFTLSFEPGASDEAQVNAALAALRIDELPLGVYRASEDRLEVTLSQSTLFIAPNGTVIRDGQSPRWLLRTANWLHLNRGKKAWTYVADAYAAGLLFLALSGMWMIPGRKGLFGRGAVLVAIGVLIPIVYVSWASP